VKVIRNGSQAAVKGETFTGSVRRDFLVAAEAPGRATASLVNFEPCARTDWHTHPLGQILIVTCGCGWVQSWGAAKSIVRAGDIVVTPPEEKHWHGATTTTAMSHIAITEALDGKAVEWMEKVTDDQYLAELAED
jgi:quercetin dioxygenase-like cupin family protein